MALPSKELICKVLNLDVVLHASNNTDYVYYWCDSLEIEHKNSIKTYELAYSCKKWCIAQGRYLQTTIVHNNGRCMYVVIPFQKGDWNFSAYRVGSQPEFVSETEELSVFKATQWVFDKVKYTYE